MLSARQVWITKASGSEPPLKCRKRIGDIQNRGRVIAPGAVRREPADWRRALLLDDWSGHVDTAAVPRKQGQSARASPPPGVMRCSGGAARAASRSPRRRAPSRELGTPNAAAAPSARALCDEMAADPAGPGPVGGR